MKRIHYLILSLLTLLLVMVPIGTVFADSAVVYDAADFSNLSGRTKAQVMQKLTEAKAQGQTYVNWDTSSFYTEDKALLTAPYSAGTISSDTLLAMEGMSNFYRWLIGVNNLSANTQSIRSLQAQALDRNFEFDHDISNGSKPEDMDDALWQEGFECDHNILSWNSTPQGAVTSWLNEGYNTSKGTWDTVGHRTAILDAAYSSIQYGYSGVIGIGKCGATDNSFINAFAAFPAAGYMPATLLNKNKSSWTVQLNTSKVRASVPSNVVITVKNMTTGESYQCTSSNQNAKISAGILNFMQPQDASGSYYTDPYQVTATGLRDVSTGNEATITYTVNFFDPNQLYRVSTERDKYAYTGNAVEPSVTVYDQNYDVLTEGTDYTLEYYNNIEEGTAVIAAKGKGSYSDTVKTTFAIEKDNKDISQSEIGSISSYTYRGTAIEPDVTVTHFGKTLVRGTDYELVYSDNIDAGTAKVTVNGIGEYTGTQEKTFQIIKGYQNISVSISQNPIELGGSAALNVTVLGGAEISYETTNGNVAAVSDDGVISGVSVGQATITIKAYESKNYRASSRSIDVSVSKDVHTMEIKNIIYADENNNTATVTKKCSVCGKEETESFTCMDRFTLWYWTGNHAISNINREQNEGASHEVEIMNAYPSTAQNQEILLATSDPDIMTVNGDTFRFVGAGTVTLTVSAKYRPSVKITHTFTVSHVFDDGVVTKVPNCAEPGIRKFTCTLCGETEEHEIAKDPENHIGTTHVSSAKEETCGTNGYSGDVCCSGCDVILQEGHVIPATGNHTLKLVPGKESMCEEGGSISYYKCEVCEKLFKDNEGKNEIHLEDTILDPLGHDLTEVGEVSAKCTQEGKKKHYKCNRCSKLFLDQAATQEVTAEDLVIPETGHDYGEWVYADEHDHKRVCRNDSSDVEYGAHTWNSGEITSEPSCTEAGVKTYTCTICNAEKTEPITALGHDIEHIAAKKETCTEDGNIECYKCGRCGKYYVDQDGQTEISEEKVLIKATGHDFGEWETAGTTEHKRTCKNDPSHVETEAHKWNAGTVTKEASETEEGEKAYECTVCGEQKTETIPKVQPEPAPVDPIDPTKEKGKDGTPYGEGASIQAAEKAIFDLKSDSDPKGTKVAPMLLKSTKQAKTSLTLTWKKPAGATKFVLYGNKCGKKNRMKKLKTLSGTKLTLKKILTAKIKKGTYYKFIVVATDKTNHVVSTSKFIHVATKGGKVGNFKSISTKAKKNKVTIKKGKSFKLAGKGVAASKKLKVKPHAVIRYESSKTAVATVSGKGVIKGNKKGTAYVYAYGQNGTVAKIKVTVK